MYLIEEATLLQVGLAIDVGGLQEAHAISTAGVEKQQVRRDDFISF